MVDETLTVYRGDTDKYGNPNKTAHGTVKGIFGWGTGSGTNKHRRNGDKGDSSGLSVDLYVRRGADLRFRDRVKRSNGEEYAVVGRPLWNQDFPFDGYDFGYVVYQLEAMNG